MKELFPDIYQITTRLTALKVPSAMHIVKAEGDVTLIDPFVLSGSETEELEALGNPTYILVTEANHVRDAEEYRNRYGAKVLANRAAVPKLGIPVDEAFGDDETLPGGLKSIEIPGASIGETIFRYNQGGGTLIVGDAIMNLQPGDRGLIMRLVGFPEGLGLMPKLVMTDKKRAAESYRNLLNHDFDRILVSHGSPVLNDGKKQLEDAINATSL